MHISSLRSDPSKTHSCAYSRGLRSTGRSYSSNLLNKRMNVIVGYMAFLEVQEEDLELIDRLWERRRRPKMRINYYEEFKLLIVKCRPGEAHQGGAYGFEQLYFLMKIRERVGVNVVMPLDGVGAATLVHNRRRKEGDRAWRPFTRNAHDWPSIVLEVGVSETIQGLRSDAHFWITNSGGRTRVVIQIAVEKSAREITMERWGEVDSGRPQRHGQPRPRKIEELTSDVNLRQILGTLPLSIPANLIYDVVPNGVLTDDSLSIL